jgi:hypothetical protein
MKKTAQSVFLGLVLPCSLHFYLILGLFAAGGGKSPLTPDGWRAMVEFGTSVLVITAPVTLVLVVLCFIFGIMHLFTVLRVASEFRTGRSQFLIGILNPSLGILASVLFIIGCHLIP